MGWGGISNLPPDFDVFGGKAGRVSIVEDAIRGNVKGLSPYRQDLFKDLKRNLLHRDFVRYFDSCIVCAAVLAEIDDGFYLPQILSDIIEPGLAVAIQQLDSVEKEVEASRVSKRRLEYIPQSSLDHLYGRARPIAVAYPKATGADRLELRYREISQTIQNSKAT